MIMLCLFNSFFMIPVTDEFGLYVQLKKPSVKNDIKPIKMQQTLKHFY